MDTKTIGKIIAQKRKEKHMTQEVLAQKLSVTAKTISHWENGYTLPDISMLIPLSNTLGISVYELLSGELENRDMTNITVSQADNYEQNAPSESDKRDKELEMTVQYAENNMRELKHRIRNISCYILLISIIMIALVYFFPLSLNKHIVQDSEMSIAVTEFKMVYGEPVIDTTDYGKVNNPFKEKIISMLDKYRYYRMPGTLFSDGTIDHITEDLITFTVYSNEIGYEIINITSGRIAINNKTYYFPNSQDFIENILKLLDE